MGLILNTFHGITSDTPQTTNTPSPPLTLTTLSTMIQPLRFCRWQVITSLLLTIISFGVHWFNRFGFNLFGPTTKWELFGLAADSHPLALYALHAGALALICSIACTKGKTGYMLFLAANGLSLLRCGLAAYMYAKSSVESENGVPILWSWRALLTAVLVDLGLAGYFLYFSYRGIAGELAPKSPKKVSFAELIEVVVEA